MDIIIEGNLTDDEGMNDLLETIIHLKAVPNSLLRVSSTEENIKGRIAFGPGGYILGGCIDDTGESGYAAIKKLLLLGTGNYAVLDVGREHSQDINQTLWIKGEKILELWPNLPESPDKLLNVNDPLLSVRSTSSPLNVFGEPRDESISRVRFKAIQVEEKRPHVKRNIAILLSSTLLTLLFLLMVIMFGNKILEPAQKSTVKRFTNKALEPAPAINIKRNKLHN